MSSQIKPGDKVRLSSEFKRLVTFHTERGKVDCWSQDELDSFEGRVRQITGEICEVAGPEETHYFFAVHLERIREFGKI